MLQNNAETGRELNEFNIENNQQIKHNAQRNQCQKHSQIVSVIAITKAVEQQDRTNSDKPVNGCSNSGTQLAHCGKQKSGWQMRVSNQCCRHFIFQLILLASIGTLITCPHPRPRRPKIPNQQYAAQRAVQVRAVNGLNSGRRRIKEIKNFIVQGNLLTHTQIWEIRTQFRHTHYAITTTPQSLSQDLLKNKLVSYLKELQTFINYFPFIRLQSRQKVSKHPVNKVQYWQGDNSFFKMLLYDIVKYRKKQYFLDPWQDIPKGASMSWKYNEGFLAELYKDMNMAQVQFIFNSQALTQKSIKEKEKLEKLIEICERVIAKDKVDLKELRFTEQDDHFEGEVVEEEKSEKTEKKDGPGGDGGGSGGAEGKEGDKSSQQSGTSGLGRPQKESTTEGDKGKKEREGSQQYHTRSHPSVSSLTTLRRSPRTHPDSTKTTQESSSTLKDTYMATYIPPRDSSHTHSQKKDHAHRQHEMDQSLPSTSSHHAAPHRDQTHQTHRTSSVMLLRSGHLKPSQSSESMQVGKTSKSDSTQVTQAPLTTTTSGVAGSSRSKRFVSSSLQARAKLFEVTTAPEVPLHRIGHGKSKGKRQHSQQREEQYSFQKQKLRRGRK